MQTEVMSSSSLPSRYQDLLEKLLRTDPKFMSPKKHVFFKTVNLDKILSRIKLNNFQFQGFYPQCLYCDIK